MRKKPLWTILYDFLRLKKALERCINDATFEGLYKLLLKCIFRQKHQAEAENRGIPTQSWSTAASPLLPEQCP